MKKIVIAILGLVVVAIVAVVLYFTVIREDAPEEFGLTEATEQSDDAADDAGSETDGEADAAPIELDGTWSVSAGSEAGYRVVEDLSGITDFEAVGRTSNVTGSIDIAGGTISAGSFEVDIASISSDDERRDGQFTGDIMNAAEFPTSTLVLTAPIEIGEAPAEGTAIDATASGDLTLRGSTNAVTFPVQAQVLNGQIEIVGSIDVLFSDFGIANPSNPFVTVRDEGKVEVRLLLDKG